VGIICKITGMLRSVTEALSAVFLVVAFSAACGGQNMNEQTEKVGGCSLDTLVVGTSFTLDEPPASAAWMKVHSMEFAGEENYRRAVDHLAAALDSAGVKVFSCSELIHIKSGPCWPPYTITLRIKADKREDTEAVRGLLRNMQIGGLAPSMERPAGYGTLFISCGRYAVDWWTVWYREKAGS